MGYELKPSYFFLQQVDELSDEAARIIDDRLKLVKINPFRNKRIEGYGLFLFRIRFEDNKREKRVVYLVDKPYIKLICILDRKDDYKDLKKYLKKSRLHLILLNILCPDSKLNTPYGELTKKVKIRLSRHFVPRIFPSLEPPSSLTTVRRVGSEGKRI